MRGCVCLPPPLPGLSGKGAKGSLSSSRPRPFDAIKREREGVRERERGEGGRVREGEGERGGERGGGRKRGRERGRG